MLALIEWQGRKFMLSRNDIHRDLLQKFDELCRKANVKYALHGRAAFLAYFNEPIHQVNSMEVLMCQGDAEKVSALLDDDAYYFEDFRSNPKFDGPYMMFGFKNSLDLKNKDLNFNTTRNIENHCIRLVIHFIERPLNKFNAKIFGVNRKILKFRAMDGDFDYRNYKSKRKFTNNVFKFINDDFYNKRIYNFKKRNIAIDTWDDIGKYRLIKITGRKPVTSNIFRSVAPVTLDGISSFIIEDFEAYATYFYGKFWRNKNWAPIRGCSSTLVSWEEFSNDPEVKKCIDEIYKRYDIIHQKYDSTLEDRRVIRNMRSHIIQSRNVIYLREDLIQNKDKIMELYDNGNLKELGVILNPLIRSLTVGIDLGYTYSIDDDVDNLLDSYLRKTNQADLANKIKDYRTEV